MTLLLSTKDQIQRKNISMKTFSRFLSLRDFKMTCSQKSGTERSGTTCYLLCHACAHKIPVILHYYISSSLQKEKQVMIEALDD